MKPCLSQSITMPSSFAEDVANYADAGCLGMEVWLTKLENHLTTHSISDTRKLLGDRGVELAAAAFQGGLLVSSGDARKAHYEHFRRRLELCEQLGIRTLIVAADHADVVTSAMLAQSIDSLAQAAQWAAGFNVTIALEFRARQSCCASLDTALALIEQCGEPNVGVNFDLFHYYTGPSKFEDLAHLSPGRLAHVQICDLSGVARELATDADRILPGDGDLAIVSILQTLRKLGYDGWIALELHNPTLWQTNPRQVAEIAYTSIRRILNDSEPAPRNTAHEQ